VGVNLNQFSVAVMMVGAPASLDTNSKSALRSFFSSDLSLDGMVAFPAGGYSLSIPFSSSPMSFGVGAGTHQASIGLTMTGYIGEWDLPTP
jgi:hypothetical protein